MITFEVQPVNARLTVYTKVNDKVVAADNYKTLEEVKAAKPALKERAEKFVEMAKEAQKFLNT